jgi:50S ribosomal protein L16 3-hydroxylase
MRAQLHAALEQAGDSHWFGAMVTEPRYGFASDDDDLAEARSLLAAGGAYVELSPAARVAWQRDPDGITVYANGQARQFSPAVVDTLAALCADWRLEGEHLAQALAQPDTARLLDYLLESGGIYVE